MNELYWKRDRTARLLKLQLLLSQHPHGMEVEEIARRCAISKRTAYRDLIALESELGVPIWERGNKRGVVEGYFLPPISFTLAEAMNIFLAIRLMRNYAHVDKSSVISTFMKLNVSVPLVLRKQIQDAITYLESQPRDEIRINNYNRIVEAWLSQHMVKIWYQTLSDEEPKERTIEPYLIEPSSVRRTSYLIAYCHLSKSIRTFNIDHITGEVFVLSDTYEIPGEFNAIDYLSSSWDVRKEGKLQKVKLHFSQKLGSTLKRSILHPSQINELQSDGSLVMTLKLHCGIDFGSWILGWGDDVEVIEPEILRNWVIEINRSVRCIYKNKRLPDKSVYSNNMRWIDASNGAAAELTDKQWKLISDILPSPHGTGRPRADDRRTINGILWVLVNGAKWADVPRKYGAPSTCHSRFLSCQKQGVWNTICQTLLSTIDEPEKSALVKAHLVDNFIISRRKRMKRERANYREIMSAGTQNKL